MTPGKDRGPCVLRAPVWNAPVREGEARRRHEGHHHQQHPSQPPKSSRVLGEADHDPFVPYHCTQHPWKVGTTGRPDLIVVRLAGVGAGLEPIIVVPSDPSALINMTNVADFLENLHFVRTQDDAHLSCAMCRRGPPKRWEEGGGRLGIHSLTLTDFPRSTPTCRSVRRRKPEGPSPPRGSSSSPSLRLWGATRSASRSSTTPSG